MPFYNGFYPALYRNQPVRLRQKAIEIANTLLENGVDENTAVTTGLEKARAFFLDQHSHRKSTDVSLPAFP